MRFEWKETKTKKYVIQGVNRQGQLLPERALTQVNKRKLWYHPREARGRELARTKRWDNNSTTKSVSSVKELNMKAKDGVNGDVA